MARVALLVIALAVLGCASTSDPLTAADRAFVEDLSHRAFLYFWEQADRGTGLVLDRAPADGSEIAPQRRIASIAATGFGLTALAIAADHHWAPDNELRDRVRVTLHFFAEKAPGTRGFFYHWMDPVTGARQWKSEVSSIDTALLLGGVLTVRRRFGDDAEIARLADQIYQRVEFPWLLRDDLTLGHGWKPETGMLKSSWNSFSELMLLYILAIGSPTHPIPAASWHAWARPQVQYHEYTYIDGHAPLFTHQYSQAWIDFRHLEEGAPDYTDWFQNSITATKAHRQFCIDLSAKFPDYGPDAWGISASDSEHGYRAWGGPPQDRATDGTLVPNAPAGSLMFTPELSLPALKYMKAKYGDKVYGRYGFTDAFNPLTGWIDPEVIGIDQGITLLSAENLRDGGVWKWFMQNPEIRTAMSKAGFVAH